MHGHDATVDILGRRGLNLADLLEDLVRVAQVIKDLRIDCLQRRTGLISLGFFGNQRYAEFFRVIVGRAFTPLRIIGAHIVGERVEVGKLQVGIAAEAECDGTVLLHRGICRFGIALTQNAVGIGDRIVILAPAVGRRHIVLTTIVENIVVDTHRIHTRHDHIVAHERGQIVETFLTEVVVRHIGIDILLQVLIHADQRRRKCLVGIALRDLLSFTVGQVSRYIGVLDTRRKQYGNAHQRYNDFFHILQMLFKRLERKVDTAGDDAHG